MTKITKKLLKDLGACEGSYDYVCANGYIGLSYKAGIRKAMREGRFSDANWFITQVMSKTQRVQYSIYAGFASADAAADVVAAHAVDEKAVREQTIKQIIEYGLTLI